MKGVVPSHGHHLTLQDVVRNAEVSDDVHVCPTKVIALENTLDGEILPLAECQAIANWAGEHDIRLHLDGARLWEAVVAQVGDGGYDGDLVQGLQAYCRCFDSVSLCFSKGLGAPIGSIIVGSSTFIKRARHIRKSIGGGLRQAGIVTAAARVAVEQTFLGGKLDASHRRAEEIARLWTARGGELGRRVETNMVWLDLDAAGIEGKRLIECGDRHGIRLSGGRIVVHYRESSSGFSHLAVTFLGLILGL